MKAAVSEPKIVSRRNGPAAWDFTRMSYFEQINAEAVWPACIAHTQGVFMCCYEWSLPDSLLKEYDRVWISMWNEASKRGGGGGGGAMKGGGYGT